MTASVDNSEASVPGIIRDPINPYLLRVNSDGSINATLSGGSGVTSITPGNGIITSATPITSTANISTAVTQPQGRLTLVTATPVMTSDQTGKGTVFYDSFIGNYVPVYNGTATIPVIIASDEISLVLNATDNTSTNLYDIFAFSNSGTLTLGTGPAWTSATARSAAIALKNGVWTNNASITLRANGASLGSITANQATYLGTIYCTGNGTTGVAFKPAAASGGSNPIVGLYNAYNRVPYKSTSLNNHASWTTTSTTWQTLDNGTGSGTSNRATWIDGLASEQVRAAVHVAMRNSAASASWCGITFDSTTNKPAGQVAVITTTDANTNGYGIATDELISLGLHFAQGMQVVGGATGTYNGVVADSATGASCAVSIQATY